MIYFKGVYALNDLAGLEEVCGSSAATEYFVDEKSLVHNVGSSVKQVQESRVTSLGPTIRMKHAGFIVGFCCC